jgi:hypothetical protein
LIPPQLYRIQSSILAGYRNLSDHVPVSVGIALKTTKSSNRISNASIMDPLFKTYVEQLWKLYKYKEDQPWEGLRQLKKVFMEAAKLVRLDRSRDKTSVEFQLTVCSKFFKAVRANEPTAVQEIVRDYNRLSACYASRASGLHLTQRFFNLWQELSANEADKAMQAGKPKNSLSKTIAVHNVASPSSLDAIWDNATNKPVRDRAAKVKLLDAHWEKVFEPKSCDSASFDELVEGYRSTFPSIAWELDAEYLDELLNKPKKSAPGPDGIPFSAYSSVKHISKKVLWMRLTSAEVAVHLPISILPL